MRSLRIAILLTFLLAPSLAAIDPPRERETWHRVRSGAFEIYGNGDPAAARRIALNLQMLGAALGKLTAFDVRSPLPTKIYVFKTDASFAPYRDAIVGRSARSTGIFVAHRDGNYVLVNGDSGKNPERVVLHELSHHYLFTTAPHAPLWFQEGLAELFSTFESNGREVTIGAPVAGHVQWLRGNPLVPLAGLFAVTTKSPEYNEGARAGGYYAQSWALVHSMLIGNEERRAGLKAFAGHLAAGKTAEEASRLAFNAELKAIEEELARYVRRLEFPSKTFTLAASETAEPGAAEPMTRAETLQQLGDLLGHTQPENHANAEAFLLEALKADETNAAVHVSLGFLSDQRGDAKKAAEHYERAMALGGAGPLTTLLYAEALLRSDGDLARTRELFRRATALHPELPRAWGGLGATYVKSGENPAEGIAALEKSWALAPVQPDVAHNLAVLYARQGNTARAREIIDRDLGRVADAEAQRRAREAVLVTEIERADVLMKAGKIPETIAIVEGVIAATTNDKLRAQLEEHVARLRATQTRNQLIDRYNEAVRKANAQDVKGALAILDDLIATGGDAEIVAKAAAMRERIGPKKR